MKREILFRGQAFGHNDLWVFGSLVYSELNGNPYIRTYEAGNGSIRWVEYRVIPETVGQFTGLRDRGGNKIFEGDIVIAMSESGFDHGKHTGKSFLVYWFDDNGAWYVKRDYTEAEREELHPLKAVVEMLANCDVKIIGNIHDHPNLLKNGQA